ncbi:MAG: amidophosphoribosyltransferase [Spirochaetales bacterium]|nr:amidophosphoribosyltransferase [Spirochaetales bacterium]
MSIHEECGVFGIFGSNKADMAGLCYYGLFSLQHRGQEACGVVVNNDGVFSVHKDLGLVGEVFSNDVLAGMPQGNAAIAHVRYGTTGGNYKENAQPMTVNHLNGPLAVSHNGNLTNTMSLRRNLELNGAIFHTTSDTEVICTCISCERLKCSSIEEAVSRSCANLEGAYSLVIMSSKKMIAVRDPLGLRPLVFGMREDGSYVAASETCALDAVHAKVIRDVEPGEMIVFSADESGKVVYQSKKINCKEQPQRTCVFEYIYFSRPDSVIDGVSVHKSRITAGKILAETYPANADIVIGVPDSGIDAAIGYAMQSHIPYETGLVKNKYTGRSFIAPSQKLRSDTVRLKLSPIKSVVSGQRIVLIDDSIVRGTTSRRIVELLREAGAKEIHVRISSPPFRHPCFYGVDIDSEEYLIANNHSIEEIAKMIGADSLAFLPLHALEKMTCGIGFCSACFDGDYPVPVPKDMQKDRFEWKIQEGV